jgi:hypothetical protein
MSATREVVQRDARPEFAEGLAIPCAIWVGISVSRVRRRRS